MFGDRQIFKQIRKLKIKKIKEIWKPVRTRRLDKDSLARPQSRVRNGTEAGSGRTKIVLINSSDIIILPAYPGREKSEQKYLY